jgi:large subunit ribosomal protein L22
MAFGEKTNERPGTRAVLRHARIAPNKVREVLALVRNLPVQEAEDVLRFSERDAAQVVGKVLHSAVANAENNDEQDPDELYVSACFADEGTTIKRWRPRARGRATRIRKRTSHITVIVSRLEDDQIERLRARRRAEQLAQRARRVAGARGDTRSRSERRRRGADAEVHDHDHDHEEEVVDETTPVTETDEVEADEVETDAPETDEVETDAPETDEVETDAADTSEVEEPEAVEVDTTEDGDSADEDNADEDPADEDTEKGEK